jgi:hypothetical protein
MKLKIYKTKSHIKKKKMLEIEGLHCSIRKERRLVQVSETYLFLEPLAGFRLSFRTGI